MRVQVKRAFTLVEILIVVIILGVLAAIVVPQFNVATQDAQTSAVETQLQTIRGQLELFRAQNNGVNPAMTNWDDMVNGNFLVDAPTNPRNNSSTIVAGTAYTDGGATDGWIWDSATGRIYASMYDETNRVWVDP